MKMRLVVPYDREDSAELVPEKSHCYPSWGFFLQCFEARHCGTDEMVQEHL